MAFAFGCAGGFAVNAIRLVTLSEQPKSERVDLDWLYWVQMVIVTLLGGILALAHDLSKEITPLVSFNLGLSVPAVLKASAELAVGRKKGKQKSN